MSNVEKGTWRCGICNFPPHLLNGRYSDCVCNGSQLIPPPLPAPPAPPPSAAASSATSSKKQQKLKPSTATSSSKKPRINTSNNNSSLYVNDVEDDGEYIPEFIAGNDTAFYSSFSHSYTMSSSGTFASIHGGTIPEEIAAWMATNHFQKACSLDDGALLALRSSGMPSAAAAANSGPMKSDNPCVALQSELCKLTITKYEPLKDLPLCQHTDPVTGVQCTFVATTLKVVDDDMTTPRMGAHPNDRCDLHKEAGPQVEKNCIRSCGRKAYEKRSLLCIVCEMAKRCRNGCEATIFRKSFTQCGVCEDAKLCRNGCKATVWKRGYALCIVCEMAKMCKNRCEATIWKAGLALCGECQGGTACTSCGGPRGLTGGSMCKYCQELQRCVICKDNPVVNRNENKCRECHPNYKPCGKCGEYKVEGIGNNYCADCRPLCKAKGCTAGAKVHMRNADRTPRTYKRLCGPKGKYCASGH